CLVCSTPITTVHLGMDACRACASFFKRAKTTGKQYPCRQGKHNCGVENEGNFVCRRCRFEKCITVGMQYEGPLRERRKATTPLLQRIKTEHKISIERRREQELQIVTKGAGHSRFPHPTEEIYEFHQDTASGVVSLLVQETFEFFKNVFPGFQEISRQEQELIFKDYFGKLSLVDSYYRTRRLWGEVNQYLMCSIVTCQDIE
ncbi:hypothetical protein PFISCL1PPCAC_13191, partial [Pristionchus fissidentatus]